MFHPRRVAGALFASPPAGRGAGLNSFFGSTVDEPDFGGFAIDDIVTDFYVFVLYD